MAEHHEKLSENKTEITTANTNGDKTAVQLKDNRQHSVVQRKLSKSIANKEVINDNKSLEKKTNAIVSEVFNIPKLSNNNSSSKKVAQLAIIHTDHTDYTGTLSTEESNKLLIVMNYVKESLKSTETGRLQAIFANVAKMKGTNPADTQKIGQAININIADWFIRISSVGDIAGMIAHEIGVHTLATEVMTDEEKSEEDDYTDRPYSQRIGLHVHKISPMKNEKKDHRQKDHINIAKDLGGGSPIRNIKKSGKLVSGKRSKELNKNSINVRAMHYVNVVLRLGDAIDIDATINQAEKDRRIHDLLNSYLFDIARILVTDDTGMRVLDKTFMVAQAYNSYKSLLLTRHQNKHTWLQRKNVQPTATGLGLIPYLGIKVARGLQDQNNYIGRGTLTGRAINTMASIASPIADGFSDVTAKYTPNIIKSTIRATDRVLGEVPSLIVPKVVDTLSWSVKKIKNGIQWFRRK